ncbi:MAG: dihydrodipicolinate reductase [Planctomycetota bacterium]
MSTKPIRVVSYGLGPIGLAVARLAATKRRLQIVGAVDTDPALEGRSLQELAGAAAPADVVVSGDAADVFGRVAPDAILHCTSSFLPRIVDQLTQAAAAGVNVVSSAEELLVPDLQHPELARTLHEAAVAGGATIVGTGINPGFVLDLLPVIASSVCADVERVRGVRVVDAATRRGPLQRKVGAGLTAAEFAREQETGRFGHIGMRESVALLGRALELELDDVQQTCDPVLAQHGIETAHARVEPGQVAGIHNVGRGRRAGELLVELDLKMYVGAPDPRDEVFLEGSAPLHVQFPGGIPGDVATAAMLVNTVAQVVTAEPGLKTVLDLAPARRLR